MDKLENMRQNAISDAELEEVSGGRNLFDIFTAEFRGKKKKPNTLEMILETEDDKGDFDINTLEMRVDPKKKTKDSEKIIKL